jgi:methylaspartate ammonia-lyase
MGVDEGMMIVTNEMQRALRIVKYHRESGGI